MVDESYIKLDFFFPVKVFDGISEIDVDLFFPFFELVKVLIVLIELRVNGILTMVKPNIQFLRA